MRSALCLLVLLLSPIALAAQSPVAAAVPGVAGDTVGAWLVLADGSAEFRDVNGRVLASTTNTIEGDRAQYIATWKDAKGTTHQVVTTYNPKGSAGYRAALLETHLEEVERYQQKAPPVP